MTAGAAAAASLEDVLEVHYYDEQNHSRLARFIFLKDRSTSAAQLEKGLHPQPMEASQ